MNRHTLLARAVRLLPALAVVTAAGCATDAALAERKAVTGRLMAEKRAMARSLDELAYRKSRLEALVRSGRTLGGAAGLVEGLERLGFRLEASAPGTLRLRLARIGPDVAGEGGLGAVESSSLARAAALLQERLPDHELSVEAGDFERAVLAVRLLHEDAGVPGPRLRAMTGRGGIALEVRPTRAETLQEVLAATMD